MSPEEFQKAINALGLDQPATAILLGVHPRTVRRWVNDEREVPPPVANFLRLLKVAKKSGAWAINKLELAA